MEWTDVDGGHLKGRVEMDLRGVAVCDLYPVFNHQTPATDVLVPTNVSKPSLSWSSAQGSLRLSEVGFQAVLEVLYWATDHFTNPVESSGNN